MKDCSRQVERLKAALQRANQHASKYQTCELVCANLKWSPDNPGFRTWVSPEGLVSVMLEYHAIGWLTMEVKWIKNA